MYVCGLKINLRLTISFFAVFRWATMPYPGNGHMVLTFLVLLGFNIFFAIIASSLIAYAVSSYSHESSPIGQLITWLDT